MAEKSSSNGVHSAKLWEIGFYALNNTSTNLYMSLVGYISYYLVGIIGVGAVSYTHLDVYKRQGRDGKSFPGNPPWRR